MSDSVVWYECDHCGQPTLSDAQTLTDEIERLRAEIDILQNAIAESSIEFIGVMGELKTENAALKNITMGQVKRALWLYGYTFTANNINDTTSPHWHNCWARMLQEGK